MKNDYGFYGSGMNGYVHYRQAMSESKQSKYPGKGYLPSTPELPTWEDWKQVFILAIVDIALWGVFVLLKYLY